MSASEGRHEFAIVGLGRMGGGLARQGVEKGHRVTGYTLNGVPKDLEDFGVTAAPALADLARILTAPRIVLLYVPAGSAVDGILESLVTILESGDIVVDGGNSYWGDSVRRAERLARHGLRLVDAGTSGGLPGARHGASFMCGGAEEAVDAVAPILRSLAVPGGFVHAGPSGAGHFVKLVHNGIEFGMLQAIAEGVDLLAHFPHKLPIGDVLECWRHGTVIRSWLIDLMASAYAEKGGLSAIPPFVEDTGEVNWLVDDAMRLEVPVPVIAQSVMQLLASRDGTANWARAIAMMRHGFGGHPFGSDARVSNERRSGRIGGFSDKIREPD